MVFWQTVLFSVVLGLGLTAAYSLVKNMHLNRSVENLRRDVLNAFKMPGRILMNLQLPPGVAVLDDGGNVVLGSINTEHEHFGKFVEQVLKVKRPTYIKLGRDEYLVAKARFMSVIGERDFYLLSPAGGMGDFLKILSRGFIIFWIFFSGISLLVGNYFVSKSLAPMNRITNELKDINTTDLTRRVYDPGLNDEVSMLAETINNMLDRLKIGFEAQNDFINDVSHELRTPLTTIQGYSELIQRFADNKEIVNESAQAIQETCAKLINLSETLLMLSRPITKLEIRSIELRSFLEDLASEFKREFNDFQIDVEGEGIGCADPKVLQIIVKALTENAIKFSKDRKQVILRCGNGWVSVKDFGIGIDESEKEKIFRRFYKGDKSRSNNGYGLGLSLVEKLSRIMGCKIDLQSKPNEGSEFTIIMPRCHEEEKI
ncbi:sensor histidine kinase [Thermotoga profunda]|uniref:sensor histidine kinase n=1 Tax=Thermotoga profunda TaxID=1508420 RepID=UPI001E3EDF3F|nr:HAMP domain-containing sensor histidine kinase [Thermotoga profunda]